MKKFVVRRWACRLNFNRRCWGLGVSLVLEPRRGRLLGNRTLYIEFGPFEFVLGRENHTTYVAGFQCMA